MGTIIPRGDGFRAQVQRGKLRPSKTFDTRQEALDWITRTEAAILEGELVTGKQTFVEAVDKFTASNPPSRSDETRLRAFKRLDWAARPLREITAETLSTWRDARRKEVSDGSVIREMTTLRAVFEYARCDLGWIKKNPIADVKRPAEPPPRDRLIAQEEIDAMLVALDWQEGRVELVTHEVAIALLLALETAMRAGEICALRPQDVVGAVAHLRKTKNGDARDVPLSTRARALFEMLSGKRLRRVRKKGDGRIFHIDAASLDALFRRARDDAGLAGFTFHDSRANALTSLAKRLEILDLARMVGHRDPRSLMIYYREPAASIAERLG